MAEYIEKETVINITAETGAWETQNRVRELPAADVQPVKRGKWENPKSVGNGIIYCSVCRNEAYWDTDYGQQLFDYCPYCGAKMKKPKQ